MAKGYLIVGALFAATGFWFSYSIVDELCVLVGGFLIGVALMLRQREADNG